jgi:RNA polymerase sigma-70 factor (ECF subfamily)
MATVSRSLQARADRAELPGLDDTALVALAREGSEAAIRTLVRRYNQRLFRATRAILRDDADAEDAVQQSYVNAFSHLKSFRGDAQFSTWLTRIAINEARGRLRSRRPTTGLEALEHQSGDSAEIIQFPLVRAAPDPEVEMSRTEIRAVLEAAVDTLPAGFRAVFVLRDIEGLSTEDTADQLSLKPETVKTRLHRARKLMREAIAAQMTGAFGTLFPFDGARCVHMADRVVGQLKSAGAI